MSITVDDSGFKAALAEYMRHSSRTIPQILNAKQQDLMFKAGKLTPATKMTEAQFVKQQTSPENVAAVARDIYNRRGGFGSGVGFGQIYRATKASMAKKKLGKAFMKSAFFKAGKKIRHAIATRTGKESAEPVDNGSPSFANVREATESAMVSTVHATWKAKGAMDAAAKERIVSEPLRQAEAVVARDMWDYIARKLGQKGREVSAK